MPELARSSSLPPFRPKPDRKREPVAPRPKPLTFSQRYARSQGVPAEEVRDKVLRVSFYPHARWLRPLLEWWFPVCYAIDEEFLTYVLGLRNQRDFSYEAMLFMQASKRRRRLQHLLRLRVSVSRLSREFRRAW